MIEINLVPEQLQRKKNRKAVKKEGKAVPREFYAGVVAGTFLVILAVHVSLQVFIAAKYKEYKMVEKELQEIGPNQKNVNTVISQLKGARTKVQEMEKVIGKNIFWSGKLNEISNKLPQGVWLKRIEFEGDILLIHGSAVSKFGDEMISVHKFTSNLKESQDFARDFSEIELGLIKSRYVNSTKVADFTISADLERPNR